MKNPKETQEHRSDPAAKSGATLKILQELKWVHYKIEAGWYDLIILQECIPELTEHGVAPFWEHTRPFDLAIRDGGDQVIKYNGRCYANYHA